VTDLSLLIVNYNSWRVCVNALRSFRAHAPRRTDGTPLSWEAIVVDNASPERDAAAEAELEAILREVPGQLLRHHENGGYSKGMNLAYAHARGRLILVSNPDVVFLPGCVEALVAYQDAHDEAGAVAPFAYWDEACEAILPPNILPTLGDLLATTAASLSPWWARRYAMRRTKDALPVWLADGPVAVPMLSGCCFLMRRAIIERVGFFDERFPLYYEDTDLSMRLARAGLRFVQLPAAKIAHLYGRSAQTVHGESMRRYWQSRRLYYQKWYGWFGARLYDATRALLQSQWGQRRARLNPQQAIVDLGTTNDKPTLRLPAPVARFLVEGSLDPHFFLACGTFGRGAEWTPGDCLFNNFGPTTYYWRVVDVSDVRRPRLAGVYRHTLQYPTRAMLAYAAMHAS
jgi:GT2 family glycosyltransferase